MLFGFGRIGKAALFYLRKLGYEVIVIDKEFHTTPKDCLYLEATTPDNFEYLLRVYSPNLVISTLPYLKNLELAQLCINTEVPYIDLGGKVENTNEIKRLAADKPRLPVSTDQGLAPGLINILAEYLVSRHKHIDTVLAYVGGIPTTDEDYPFNYYCSWSLEGLSNEYADDCTIIQNGYVKNVLPLSGHEFVYSAKLGKKLEVFCTSGASAHSIQKFVDLGIKNFKYKTLRYVGHRNFVKTILEEGTKENLESIFGRLSASAPVKTDKVIGIVKLIDKHDNEVVSNEFVINPSEGFTAMQVATAVPLVVVGSMILDGFLPQKYITYDDIIKHMAYFQVRCKHFGVEFKV